MQVWKFTTWRFICRGILYSFLNGLFYSAQLRFTQSSACTNNSSFLLLNSILLDTGVVPVFHSVQSLTSVQLFATLWTAVCQASLSFTISWSLLKLMSIESVMPSNHRILCRPLLLKLMSIYIWYSYVILKEPFVWFGPMKLKDVGSCWISSLLNCICLWKTLKYLPVMDINTFLWIYRFIDSMNTNTKQMSI